MATFIDLTGNTFSRLTVISQDKKVGKHLMWNCVCTCGNHTKVSTTHLRQRKIHSCGCLRDSCAGDRARTHGMTGTTEYRSWQKMKERCLVKACKDFKNYGARGITICERWLNSFENFFADMGEKPKGYSIERINNELGYNPENCKWATVSEQNSNTRYNVYVTYNGETMMIRDWSRRLGGGDWLVGSRLKRGWDDIRAITQPVRKYPNEVK